MVSGAPDGGLTGRLAFTAIVTASSFGEVFCAAFYFDGSMFR